MFSEGFKDQAGYFIGFFVAIIVAYISIFGFSRLFEMQVVFAIFIMAIAAVSINWWTMRRSKIANEGATSGPKNAMSLPFYIFGFLIFAICIFLIGQL